MDKFTVACIEIVRDDTKPPVKAKTYAPLTGLSILGFAESVILVALSFYYRDGMSLLATLFLSFLSTLIGISNKWKLVGAKRLDPDARTPPGDVVIRYPQGSFLVVKCDEGIARELYFAPEDMNYLIKQDAIYRLLSLIGTLMLMFSVVALGNSKNVCQVAFGASFVLLNAAYWMVAALPARLHWDTSNFVVHRQRLEVTEEEEPSTEPTERRFSEAAGKASRKIEKFRRTKVFTYKSKTYTQALWKVIALTRNIDWVRKGNAAPTTESWDQWLRDALEVSQNGHDGHNGSIVYDDEEGYRVWRIPPWDPQEVLKNLIAELAGPSPLSRRGTEQANGRPSLQGARRRDMVPLV